MAHKNVAKNIRKGFFAYAELEQFNKETTIKEKVFVKVGFLESTALVAMRLAQKKYPGVRLHVKGVKTPAGPFIVYKPTKGQPDYSCFSSRTANTF